MAKFMFVFRGGGYTHATPISPQDLQAHLARWTAWSDGLLASGKLVGGHPLAFPPTGKVVRGTEKVVLDGPYAEAKDLVSGIVILEAASIEEATALAKGCPILEHADGTVEVRPLAGPPPTGP